MFIVLLVYDSCLLFYLFMTAVYCSTCLWQVLILYDSCSLFYLFMTAVYCSTFLWQVLILYDSCLLFYLFMTVGNCSTWYLLTACTSPKDVEHRATLGTSTIIFHADPFYLTSHVHIHILCGTFCWAEVGIDTCK